VIEIHGQGPFEMRGIENEQPGETLGPDRSDEPFRDPIGVRHLNWRANDSSPLCLEDRIEAVRKLAVVIANQKAYWLFTFGERPCDLSGPLRHPLAIGMRRAAGEVHAAAADFDEEEHIQPLELNGIDGARRSTLRARHLPQRRGRYFTIEFTHPTRGSERWLQQSVSSCSRCRF
jgi:hypothetical protein